MADEPRCTIQIRMVQVNEKGQVIDELVATTITQASTDTEKLEGIVDWLTLDAYAYMESNLDKSTLSALYPDPEPEEELVQV